MVSDNVESVAGQQPNRYVQGMKAVWITVTTILTLALQAHAGSGLFPERVGAEWRYRSRAIPVEDPEDTPIYAETTLRIERIRHETTARGDATIFTIREHDGFSGRYRISEWASDASGVRVSGIEYPGPLAGQADGYAFTFLKLPWAAGSRFDDGEWVTRVMGQEDVALPDGQGGWRTSSAWKIHAIGTRLDGAGSRDYTAVGNYWIVPGWGIARSELNAAGYYLDSMITEIR